MAGREITLEKPAEKVVAIGSALRIYTYINGTEKLVGVEPDIIIAGDILDIGEIEELEKKIRQKK